MKQPAPGHLLPLRFQPYSTPLLPHEKVVFKAFKGAGIIGTIPGITFTGPPRYTGIFR